MVASLDPTWLQGTSNALLGLFERVGLQENVGKTVIMLCHPCQATAVNITQAAYRRRITGEGNSYKEWQRERVECAECGEQMAVRSMLSHLMTRHRKAAGRRGQWKTQTEDEAQVYRMSSPTKGGPWQFPVEG